MFAFKRGKGLSSLIYDDLCAARKFVLLLGHVTYVVFKSYVLLLQSFQR